MRPFEYSLVLPENLAVNVARSLRYKKMLYRISEKFHSISFPYDSHRNGDVT